MTLTFDHRRAVLGSLNASFHPLLLLHIIISPDDVVGCGVAMMGDGTGAGGNDNNLPLVEDRPMQQQQINYASRKGAKLI